MISVSRVKTQLLTCTFHDIVRKIHITLVTFSLVSKSCSSSGKKEEVTTGSHRKGEKEQTLSVWEGGSDEWNVSKQRVES